MRTRNKRINLDRTVGAEENISPGEKTMRNASTKTPWHLRFAPGAILRQIGRLAFKAVSLASAIIQPIRQRLNQWNWRKKTALVTALAIVTGGVFYQQRTQAAALLGVILAAKSADFFVKFFIGYAIGKTLNSAFAKKLQKTAAAAPDGEPLYRNREYLQRNYYYGDAATRNGGQNGRSVDAKAMANQLQAYDTSGTDSSLDPTSLYPDEVLDEVSDNANLNGRSDTYKILVEVDDGEWDHLYTDTNKYHNARQARYYTVSWGGYVKKPTDAEIQAELDQWREEWNNELRLRRGWQRPIFMGKLKLGERTRYKREKFTCDKKIKLWSDFEFNRVPGDTSAGPNELQQPGKRSKYVTSFSYIAREAGYNGSIVTKVPENEKPRIDYPEPKSWEDHDFMPFDLTQIPWGNFKIIGDPVWTGEATRFFKHKKVKWCIQCNQAHPTYNWGTWLGLPWCTPKTRHEYPVYQNESVTKP